MMTPLNSPHEPPRASMAPTRPAGPPGAIRHAAAGLLIALTAFFATAPFVDALPNGRYVDALLATGVLAAAVAAIGTRTRPRVIASVLAAPWSMPTGSNVIIPKDPRFSSSSCSS